MPTFEQIKEAAKNIEHIEIVDQLDKSGKTRGVRFQRLGYVVEIFPHVIAVKEEDEDNLSWEFIHDLNLENVQFTVMDPGWMMV